MNRLETKMLRLPAVVGAGLWFARLVFSSKARNEGDAAMRAIDKLNTFSATKSVEAPKEIVGQPEKPISWRG